MLIITGLVVIFCSFIFLALESIAGDGSANYVGWYVMIIGCMLMVTGVIFSI